MFITIQDCDPNVFYQMKVVRFRLSKKLVRDLRVWAPSAYILNRYELTIEKQPIVNKHCRGLSRFYTKVRNICARFRPISCLALEQTGGSPMYKSKKAPG